jgi:hypothetical protein
MGLGFFGAIRAEKTIGMIGMMNPTTRKRPTYIQGLCMEAPSTIGAFITK